MSSIPVFQKAPYDILPYTINYTAELDAVGQTIASSAWVVPSNITDSANNTSIKLLDNITTDYGSAPFPTYALGGTSYDDTQATVYLSGGTLGQTYTIENTIVTNGGLQYGKQFQILVQNR